LGEKYFLNWYVFAQIGIMLIMFEQVSKSIINKCSKIATQLAFANFGRFNHYDPRLSRRTIQVAEGIYSCPGTKFSQVFKTKAEKKAAYRLIGNEALDPNNLISSITKASVKDLKDRGIKTILVTQDTSSISTKDFDDVGTIGSRESRGFFFHSSLALDQEGTPLNLLGMKIFTRPKEVKESREEWKKLPIEEKESYRWLESAKEIVKILPLGVKAIFISDRESDIHEYFECLIALNTAFVVRHSHNRRTKKESGELSCVREELKNSPVLGKTEIVIPKGHNKKERIAKVSLQWKEVTFHIRSGGLAIHKNRNPITLTTLRVFEEDAAPDGERIDWILYTNLSVKNVAEALEVVRIYTCRWRIEEFHLTLKSGMKVEKNRFESGENIQRLLTLSAPMAVKLLELQYKSRKNPDLPALTVMSEMELKAVKSIAKIQTGKVPRSLTISQAIKHIAFLGGWMGRKGDGPPGIRTLWEGWRQIQFLVMVMESQNGCT
jgi:hypothetical protein